MGRQKLQLENEFSLSHNHQRSIVRISAVVVVVIDKGVNDAHHHNSMRKASTKNLGNHVVDNMALLRQNCSVFPDRGGEVAQLWTFILVREKIGIILSAAVHRKALGSSLCVASSGAVEQPKHIQGVHFDIYKWLHKILGGLVYLFVLWIFFRVAAQRWMWP